MRLGQDVSQYKKNSKKSKKLAGCFKNENKK
jgi:hypothetical protein